MFPNNVLRTGYKLSLPPSMSSFEKSWEIPRPGPCYTVWPNYLLLYRLNDDDVSAVLVVHMPTGTVCSLPPPSPEMVNRVPYYTKFHTTESCRFKALKAFLFRLGILSVWSAGAISFWLDISLATTRTNRASLRPLHFLPRAPRHPRSRAPTSGYIIPSPSLISKNSTCRDSSMRTPTRTPTSLYTIITQVASGSSTFVSPMTAT